MLGRKLSVMMLLLLATLMFLAVFAAVPVMAEDTGAKIWTDKADYSSGETVIIYGSGFVADASVTITVTRPDNSTDTWAVTSDSSGSFTTNYVLDGITGTYTVTATDGTNTATTTFTDAPHNVNFATSGLPSGVSITISHTRTNPAGKIVTESTTFTSPGPSANVGTTPGTTFTYSGFPSSVTVSGVTYKLVSTYPASGFTTGASGGTTTVTATYALADTTPPDTSITAGPTGWINVQSATFSWTGSDDVTAVANLVYSWRLDGGTWSAYSTATSTSLSGLAEGSHTFEVRAKDEAGNVDPTPAARSFSVDVTPPSISVSVSPAANPAGWHKTDVTVTFSAFDGGSGIASVTGPITVSTEGAGQVVTGSATDVAGNSASVSVTLNIDKTAPTITGAPTTSPNAYGWYNTAVTVDFTATDALSGIDTFSGDVTLSTEGADQSATATATDKAGNSASLTIDNIDIDMTPPTITGSRTPSANSWGWNNEDVTVSFAVSDGLSGVDPATAPSDVVLSGEGAGQSVTGTVYDKAGNSASATVSDINIDKTAPAVSLAADRGPDSNGWYNHMVSFIVTATDAMSGVDPALTVTPAAYSGPDTASKTVTGSATDKAGNTASADLTFKYDATPPTTTKSESGTSGLNGWYVSSVTVTLSASDPTPGSGVDKTYYRINGGGWNEYAAAFTLGDGTYTVDYYSVDVAGNAETTKSQTIKVDTKAPTTTLTIGEPKWGTDPTYVFLTTPFTLSATDPAPSSGVAKTEYSFDGTTSWTTYTGPFTAPSIGSHTLYYRSIDNAGNVEPYKSISIVVADVTVESGFKPGDSPSFASDPYLSDIMCVLVKATGGYKLVGTSPGTYDYAISIKNTGTSTFDFIKIIVNGHSDFILQSSNPIRVLSASGSDITSQFTVSGTWPTITISSKSGSGFQLPPSASIYVTIHLDYAKKGTIFGSQIYSQAYTFKTTVTGACTSNLGKDAWGSVAFLSKKATIICGFVKTSSGEPIKEATIQLYKGDTLLNTEITDADGFFCFIDGWDGVTLSGGITYTVKCTLPPDSTVLPTQSVTAQASKAVAVNFTKP